MNLLANIAFALMPVVVFLLAMVILESYKLVAVRAVVLSLAAGVTAALVALPVNSAIFASGFLAAETVPRYITPVIEELLKAVWVVYLVKARRVGFLVDAAIVGFAVGAGFALAENINILQARPEASLFVWIVRGFGTAIMHGSTTLLVAVVSQDRVERTRRRGATVFIPGLLLAVVVHSVFNHFFVSPATTAAGLLLGLPALIYFVFRAGHDALQRWLGTGFDTDAEMLRAINSGRLGETPVGTYLGELRDRFSAEVVTDIFCLLRLTVELSIEAKGAMMMRKQGIKVPPSAELREKLIEVAHLERSIGATGRLAVRPLLPRGRRDFWQRQLLN